MFLSKKVPQAKLSIVLERLKTDLIAQAKDTNNVLSYSDKTLKISAFFFFFLNSKLIREQEENYELGAANYWNRKYNVMKYKVEHNDEICFSNICSKAFCKINTDLLYQTTQVTHLFGNVSLASSFLGPQILSENQADQWPDDSTEVSTQNPKSTFATDMLSNVELYVISACIKYLYMVNIL